ncbi:MAG: patatin-like phospholipase family protein [Oscillatoriaceae cyanobacterium Prado104]|jgi:predicted acylesterase/phospholipase RssA|nr:patatin-like phospholipase family protein [Oscillatoriaceae cyanobacterium Prado104]
MSPQISGLGEPIRQIPIDGKIPIGDRLRPIREAEFGTPLSAPTILVDGTFEGGGTLGAAYAGALLALARNKIWFKRVAGNSAGAITASLIAAGYDANEIDLLFTPADIQKNRPSNLPATVNQNAIDYSRFVDLPTSAADISPETKKNHLIYKLVKGAILDEIREAAIDLPATSQMVDAIFNKVLAKLPAQVGPFNWTIPGETIRVKTPGKLLDKIPSHLRQYVDEFDWSISSKTIQVGPFNLSITSPQQSLIRNAIVEALQVYPTRLSLSQLNFINTEALRTEFANRFVDEALNIDPFYRLFLNFVGDGGVFKGDEFLKTMRKLLQAKINKNPVTFKDLPIDLAVIAADTTDHKMVIYSKEFSPVSDMEVAEAVRRSMSIPFIYEPRIDNGHEIMDGGLCENYPFWIHLINQSGEDASRIKIGFDLVKEKEDSEGCPDSVHRAANIAANSSGSFVDSILDPQLGSLPGDNSATLVEAKLLHRIANVNETRNQKTALHDAMIDYYSNHSSFKFYPVEIAVRGRGFFWLDFKIEKTTYNGLCCRGWEATIAMLKERSLVADNDLVTANPYKEKIWVVHPIST